ncbi:SprT family zinc-dependent metalloprotease [Algibacter sp. AS12]|uniref:M48 family metallopeptidase n=1 Tax=Algibacter sp. AS12 TaxID=3135773 RepID=UPI00398ABCC9
MIVSGLDIVIQKSERKTVSIYIERDGTVSARVPEKLKDEEIRDILKAKEYQIFKNLAEWEQLNENAVEREYVNGQSFLYLGRNYRLKLVDEKLEGVQFKKNAFFLNKLDKHKAKELFVKFYKDKLNSKIHPIIERYKNQLGVEPNEIKVMELQNRWASCMTNGNVNFHWKCAMAPIDVLHYIVVHELAHLIYNNHSQAFWNEVDKILPNYDEQVNWLKINGVGMDL